MQLKEIIKQLLIPRMPEPIKAIEPGLYHYQRAADGMYTRFHLRVEPDGRGLLLANASASAHLSPVGVLIAKELLDGAEPEQVLKEVESTFSGASLDTMTKDVERVNRLIQRLANPEDNYPVNNLEDAAVSPYDAQLLAPLEADIPLAPADKLVPIIDRLWEVAIPHVTFLAPENPNGADLIRAVERAEDLGLIAGVRGRATDFVQEQLVYDLAMAGVDYMTVIVASSDAAVHDALLGEGDFDNVVSVIKAIQENEVAPVVEIPLIAQSLRQLDTTLDFLLQMDIHNFSFFAIAYEGEDASEAGALPAMAMPQTADMVEELASQMDVRFIWQPPVQRNPALTLAEQVRQGPRCSGDVAVRIEPSGAVIPARGPNQAAGNILKMEWNQIWNNKAFRNYRERVERPTRCDDCPGLAICAADCPRKTAGWALTE